MAFSRITNPVETLQNNIVIVPITFQPHGTGTPVFDATNTYMSGVTRDGYGTYTITLRDTYSTLLGYSVSYSDAGTTEHVVKLTTPFVSSSSFSTVGVHMAGNDGGNVDPDYEDDGFSISVILVATK